MSSQDILIAIVLGIFVIGGIYFNIQTHIQSKKNDNKKDQ